MFVAALGVLASAGCSINISGFGTVEPLQEAVVAGQSGPKIALVEIEGFISEEGERRPLTGDRWPSQVARIREALKLAAKDDEVEAVLLRIRSPGGTVSASETLHHEILEWKKRTSKPVHAYLQGLATSGGYYVAVASDRIVSHPTAVTGSIGVIMLSLDLTGLMQKIGVKDQTFTSGPYKDAGSWLRPMRSEEREQIQGIVDDMHDRFKTVVSDGRPHLSNESLDRVADGRVFSARQAKEAGLIDGIGYLDDTVNDLKKRLGRRDVRLVIYKRPQEYRSNYYAEGTPARIDVSLVSMGKERFPPGFYYVWPPALGLP